MAALAFFARVVLTLLLSTLSLCVYKWLRTSSPLTSAASTKRSRKRSRKKPAQPAPAADSRSPPPQALPQPPAPDNVVMTSDNNDASASDSDDGCSAAQVLAKRRFKPKSLGGRRLARDIKASVVSATDATRFNVNDKVLARFQGGDKWFPATVLEQRKGHLYHLKYDDGEIEFHVPAVCIKPQATTTTSEEDGREAGQAVYAAAREPRADDAAGQGEASDAESSASDDEGWQVVGTSRAAVKRPVHRLQAASLPEPLVDGLTKRQRENRRKKERQREKKELLREQAQKDDLDARARWRYVPS